MSIQMLTQIFLQYGALFIFLLVLLEYMNLPGLPAGIITVSYTHLEQGGFKTGGINRWKSRIKR